MAKHTCYVCGMSIEDGDEEIPVKGKHAHVICFNSIVKATAEKKQVETKEKKAKKTTQPKERVKKNKIELKDAMSEEEFREKTRYFNYIRELTGENAISAKVAKLSGDYIDSYNATYTELLNTLVYYYEFLNHEPKGDCVGIIPYYIDESRKYLRDLNTPNNNKEVIESGLSKKKKVKITPPKLHPDFIPIDEIGI